MDLKKIETVIAIHVYFSIQKEFWWFFALFLEATTDSLNLILEKKWLLSKKFDSSCFWKHYILHLEYKTKIA